MKHLIFQLKSYILKNVQTIMKKPLFLEILIGAFFSFVIIVISVSGFEKEVYKEEFDVTELETAGLNLQVDNENLFDDEIDWAELNRGDALSEITNTITGSSSISRTTTAPTTVPTNVPVVTVAPTVVPVIEDENEIEELPEVTILPEVTSEPEPEVILDPNGPVIVADMDSSHYTTSFSETITITGYNPSGEKLSKEYFNVVLNETKLYPELSYNGSLSYCLNYNYGINNLSVYVSDENNNSKIYEFLIFYQMPDDLPAIVSVDADAVGLGYMITPTPMEVEEGKTVAAYVKELLSLNGYSTFSTGSQNSHYVFRGLYRSDLYKKCEPQIPEKIIGYILDNYIPVSISEYYNNFIKNGYFLTDSKWIFEINGVRYFDSMSNYTLNEGDVLKVRFTLLDGEDLDYLKQDYNPESITETSDSE